jgi:hypothetical protein
MNTYLSSGSILTSRKIPFVWIIFSLLAKSCPGRILSLFIVEEIVLVDIMLFMYSVLNLLRCKIGLQLVTSHTDPLLGPNPKPKGVPNLKVLSGLGLTLK